MAHLAEVVMGRLERLIRQVLAVNLKTVGSLAADLAMIKVLAVVLVGSFGMTPGLALVAVGLAMLGLGQLPAQ